MRTVVAVVALLVGGCASSDVVEAPAASPAQETVQAPATEPQAPTVAAPVEGAEATPVVATPAAPPVVAETPVAPPVAEPPRPFVFENSEPWPRPNPGSLATTSYPPSEKEAPFLERVFGGKTGPFNMAGSMSMPRDVGKDVAWFGVVRGIRTDAERGETRLLLENKYFDGLTDTHILCVSFAGGGDFVAVLPGTDHPVKPLALVRVYGRVASVKDDVPRVQAQYVRHFDQGTYTFMFVNGTPAGNQEWRKLCRVPDDRIYSPFPKPSYYDAVLGRREDFAPGKVDVPRD
jgi:hypothetical protein